MRGGGESGANQNTEGIFFNLYNRKFPVKGSNCISTKNRSVDILCLLFRLVDAICQ